MAQEVVYLIQQIKKIVPGHEEFFDALCDWYEDVDLTRKIFKLLLRRDSAGAEVSVWVNGELLEKVPAIVPADARVLTWTLPGRMLKVGENEVAISVERRKPGLHVQGASIAQEHGLPKQSLDLAMRDPSATPYFGLARAGSARYNRGCWTAKGGTSMIFRLRLLEPGPATFRIDLAQEDTSEWLRNLEEVLEEIVRRLERERQEQRRERDNTRNPDRASQAQRAIDMIDDYLRLHAAQVEPAITSGSATTLGEVIARTGDPTAIIRGSSVPSRPRGGASNNPPPLPRSGAGSGASAATAVKAAATPSFVPWIVASLLVVTAGAAAWQFIPKFGGSSTGVMKALRASADDLGWKRDAEKELGKEQFTRIAQGVGDAIGENIPMLKLFDDDARIYLVGERIADMPANKELEEMIGIPPCKRMLAVYDLRKLEDAGKYIDLVRQNSHKGFENEIFKQVGARGEIVALSVAGADTAFAVRVTDQFGEQPMTSWARMGQYILTTYDLDRLPNAAAPEHQRRFEALVKRLKEIATR